MRSLNTEQVGAHIVICLQKLLHKNVPSALPSTSLQCRPTLYLRKTGEAGVATQNFLSGGWAAEHS